MALIDKLTAIADAIRDKTGDTALLTLDAMPTAISNIETGGGDELFTAEDFVFKNSVPSYTLSGSLGTKLVDAYGDMMTFTDVSEAQYLFSGNTADLDRLTINIKNFNPQNFMRRCYAKKLPKLVGTLGTNAAYAQYAFSDFHGISEFPKSFYEGVAWEDYPIGLYSAFNYCKNLRKAPIEWFRRMKLYSLSGTYAGYQGVLASCYSLDEINGYPVNTATFTSNIMTQFAASCHRLAEFTFQTNEDGTPLVAQWKGQTIELHTSIGYGLHPANVDSSICGITADKEVYDDATYQALKNDPDWFTRQVAYSRYNHDSAVNTINSLPDTSAYLATAGGTNTIKFQGAAGSATDGGAINTLTEEEIAIAAAKGWTVTLS